MSKLNLSFSERIGMGIGFILGSFKGPGLSKAPSKADILSRLSLLLFPSGFGYTSPSTDESYRKVLKEECLEPESITLDDGTHVHLLGDDSAEKVLLFFHGGGYVTPAVDAHFKLLVETIHQVEEHGGRLKIFFLQYDLAVVSPYPRQLQQASALLKYTLTTLGKQPEQILLAGDSAGGHLALALLSHILHPHPTVHPIKLDGRFSSVALLSPWVTFDTGKTRSMRLNRYKDALAIPTLNAWSSTFIGNAPLIPIYSHLRLQKIGSKDYPFREC
ncbi:alpha/beta-hydrolase [Penicillium hetheringtonii]|uniref:Alpha/beta-hydrolase n=1 Tax=Penicillium hetheringtonii TaxID=911720 RepID=A0AAD6DGU1_9EURO|nr:alpha/beta-hydrolase [Penicillium hetheringtonii]